MIILGDISGIQSYLFDVAEAGGGQAQRLRARSFVIQLVAETAALQVLRALGWSLDKFVLSGAGKFVLRGPSEATTAARLAAARQTIDDWLLREARGELRLALALADSTSEVEAYRQAQQELQRAKARPWAPSGAWEPGRLVLRQLDTPCALCSHSPAEKAEADVDTGEVHRVCHWCATTRDLGRRLPRAHWLVIRDNLQEADLDLFGLGIAIADGSRVAVGADTLAVANLREPDRPPDGCPPERFLRRRPMAHVPTDDDGGVTWFEDLAQRARGDSLLGVLKADVDSLGAEINRRLAGSDLRPLAEFSDALDAFFADRLKREMQSGRDRRWRSIYTVFAGGDDLVMVGPWDVMLDFAGRIQELFREQFGRDGLTLSAGLALIKWKRPLKPAVAEAERLLEQAKTQRAPLETEYKDQLACFGQMWKWKEHRTIMGAAQQLVEWVEDGQLERGWLHTLLDLAVARHPHVLLHRPEPAPRHDALATARLAHHVARNYRRGSQARGWAEQLVQWFDDPTHVEVRYLPAIARYALTATRAPGEEE
jgi:CRISPR-associated protein Csm1